jgi:hypothetical protein
MSFTTTNTVFLTNVQQSLHISHEPTVEGTLLSLNEGKSSSRYRDVGHQAQRKKLLSSLRGRTIRVPDLVPLFQHWPTKANSELAQMNVDVHDWLNK